MGCGDHQGRGRGKHLGLNKKPGVEPDHSSVRPDTDQAPALQGTLSTTGHGPGGPKVPQVPAWNSHGPFSPELNVDNSSQMPEHREGRASSRPPKQKVDRKKKEKMGEDHTRGQ